MPTTPSRRPWRVTAADAAGAAWAANPEVERLCAEALRLVRKADHPAKLLAPVDRADLARDLPALRAAVARLRQNLKKE
jgi:hypothetical protein